MANFDIACDWLSWSIKRPLSDSPGMAAGGIRDHILSAYPELRLKHLQDTARAPYKAHFELGVGGMAMFSHLLTHALVEVTGRGCRALENNGDFYALATRIVSNPLVLNITRFDLAVDFETNTDPEAFANMRSERFKSGGVMESETGKTCYVGSPSARKRARVYRYNPPHDRSHLLRVEMVFKKGVAAEALSQYLTLGPVAFAAAAGNSFGWHHSDWCFDSDEKIKGWRPETGDAGTLRWIRNAVIPALKKLHESPDFPDSHEIWRLLAENTPLDFTPDTSDDE